MEFMEIEWMPEMEFFRGEEEMVRMDMRGGGRPTEETMNKYLWEGEEAAEEEMGGRRMEEMRSEGRGKMRKEERMEMRGNGREERFEGMEEGEQEGREGPTPRSQPVLGCMDPAALNYNHLATIDDGSCKYSQPTPAKTGTVIVNQIGTLGSVLLIRDGKQYATIANAKYVDSNAPLGAPNFSIQPTPPNGYVVDEVRDEVNNLLNSPYPRGLQNPGQVIVYNVSYKKAATLEVYKSSLVVSKNYIAGHLEAETFAISLTAKNGDVDIHQLSFNIYADDDGNFGDIKKKDISATGDMSSWGLVNKAHLYEGNTLLDSSHIVTSSGSTPFEVEGNGYTVTSFNPTKLNIKNGQTRNLTVKLDLKDNSFLYPDSKYIALDMDPSKHIYAEDSVKNQAKANAGNLNRNAGKFTMNPYIKIKPNPCAYLNRAELAKIVITNTNGLQGYKAPATQTFADVDPKAWYYDYIEAAIQLGIISGYSDGNGKLTGVFGPGDGVTKAAYAKIISNAYALLTYSPKNPTFLDVNKTEWYYDYIETAYKAGYFKKHGVQFYPNYHMKKCDIVYPKP